MPLWAGPPIRGVAKIPPPGDLQGCPAHLLTKHTYKTPAALIAAGALAAAALFASGAVADTGAPQEAVGDAAVAELAPLQRPVDNFHRVVVAVAGQIRAEQRQRRQAREQRADRERHERFADLPGGVTIATLETIASCESGGDPTAVSADGSYRGLYQFDYGTWESVGGHGDPAAAPADEQDYRAALLYSRSGSSPWPICG
jgi:hypothetical protein